MDKWNEPADSTCDDLQAALQLEAEIDQALSSYAAVEAPAGFEERLLRTTNAAPAATRSLRTLVWMLSGWAAAAALLLLWLGSTAWQATPIPTAPPATHIARPQIPPPPQSLATVTAASVRPHQRATERRANTLAGASGFNPIVFAPIQLAALN